MARIFDHIAVVAETLEEGISYVEGVLGVTLAQGGRHDLMATWNRVIRLGPGEYLEVIATDPTAPKPDRARWFALDEFSGPPEIGTFVCRVSDLAAELSKPPYTDNRALPLVRGALRWQIGVAEDGVMPFEGACPSLIEWESPHPTDGMPDVGLSLKKLEITHPDESLAENANINDPRIEFKTGTQKRLRALIATPKGDKWLG